MFRLLAILLFLGIVSSARPSTANCTATYIQQVVDHFSAAIPPTGNVSWAQRVFICSAYYTNTTTGSIFFYTGNEGNVELYVNHTGLMWENAAAMNALLVFAEHRYYGSSWPLGDAVTSLAHMQYLTSQQAIADYAVLLRLVRQRLGSGGESVPAIAFGGSYGGVLAATLRLKYPGSVDGAISASAPLRAFPGQSWDSSAYYTRITADAGAAGGSPPACAANVRSLWGPLFADGQTPEGRTRLSESFRTCSPLATADDSLALAFWIRSAFDSLSMGNYPYASNYITGGAVVLPPYPARIACSHIATPISSPAELYAGVRDAVGVLINASGLLSCFDIGSNPYTHPEQPYDGIWDYQQCVEFQPDSQWFATNGESDMFWPQPYNMSFLIEHCKAAWNVSVTVESAEWMTTAFDLPRLHSGGSNVIFSTGSYDPWGSAGIVVSPAPARSLISLTMAGAAHHLDLMFSDPADPADVTQARIAEATAIAQWIELARSASRS